MVDPSTLAWLAAGVVAGVADYGLGLGFGLAASLILVAFLGYDPRSVAAAAAAAQLATGLPAVVAHRRAGNIGVRGRGDGVVLLVVSASSTLAALVASAAASRASGELALLLYTAGLALLIPPLLAVAGTSGREERRGGGLGVAALAGFAAGFEKAVVGGGYTVLMVAAQVAAGVDARSAVALAPLAKMLPFAVVVAVYYSSGYFSPTASALLAVGALLSLPLATRLLGRLHRTSNGRLLAALLAAALLVQAARGLEAWLNHTFLYEP